MFKRTNSYKAKRRLREGNTHYEGNASKLVISFHLIRTKLCLPCEKDAYKLNTEQKNSDIHHSFQMTGVKSRLYDENILSLTLSVVITHFTTSHFRNKRIFTRLLLIS